MTLALNCCPPPTGASAQELQGTAADDAAAVGNPVQVGGVDGSGNIQPLLVDTTGQTLVNNPTQLPTALGPAIAAGSISVATPTDEIGAAAKQVQGVETAGNNPVGMPITSSGIDYNNKVRIPLISLGGQQASAGSIVTTPATLYRANVVANDVLSPPSLGSTSAVAGGSLAAATYKIKVAGVNNYGRTTATAGADVVITVTNLTIRIPITQLVGATFYDIYLSTATDPLWVCRISETQRASGIVCTAAGSAASPGTFAAGGIANSVDIQVAGTGRASNTSAAVSTALVIPGVSSIIGVGWGNITIDFEITLVGDFIAPSLGVLFLTQNNITNIWEILSTQSITFGGVSGVAQSLNQRVVVTHRGMSPIHILLVNMNNISNVDLYYLLN